MDAQDIEHLIVERCLASNGEVLIDALPIDKPATESVPRKGEDGVSCAVSCANAGIEVIATATNAEMAARVDVGLNRCIEAGKRGFVHAGVGWLGCGGHVEDSVRGRSPSGRRRTENAAEITKLGPPPFQFPLMYFFPA